MAAVPSALCASASALASSSLLSTVPPAPLVVHVGEGAALSPDAAVRALGAAYAALPVECASAVAVLCDGGVAGAPIAQRACVGGTFDHLHHGHRVAFHCANSALSA